MATKLQVYNDALRILAENPLAALETDPDLKTEAQAALDDAYDEAVTYVLRAADWRFALKTTTLTHNALITALPGFAYAFEKPVGWLKTSALFLLSADNQECPFDARETVDSIHANAASSAVIRYVSTDGATEADWPEQFASTVAAYLAFLTVERITGSMDSVEKAKGLYQSRAEAAAQRDALPPNEWLSYQLDGSFIHAARAVLEYGAWRFATKTATLTAAGTPSVSYSYRYAKPVDWVRSVDAYEFNNPLRLDWSYRDEGGAIHSNLSSLTLRYVSSDGLSSVIWPAAFEDAVLAYCKARQDPKMVEIYKDRLRAALNRDELSDRPRIIGPGLFTAARWGGTGRWGRTREQGIPWTVI